MPSKPGLGKCIHSLGLWTVACHVSKCMLTPMLAPRPWQTGHEWALPLHVGCHRKPALSRVLTETLACAHQLRPLLAAGSNPIKVLEARAADSRRSRKCTVPSQQILSCSASLHTASPALLAGQTLSSPY